MKACVYQGVLHPFFALTDVFYNSLILAVRECTESINHILVKLQLDTKSRKERCSCLPGKARCGFCCSLSPALLIHPALLIVAKIFIFCTILWIKKKTLNS